MTEPEFDLIHLTVLSSCCEQPLDYNSEDERFQCSACGSLTEYGMAQVIFIGQLAHLELSVDKIASSRATWAADGSGPRVIVDMKNGKRYVLKAEKVTHA